MRTLLLISLTVFGFACGTSTQDQVDIPALKAEVIGIHDEVMPKMGELRKVSKELRLAAQEDSAKVEWMKAADAISEANESMMVWMRGFEPNFEGTDEEIIAYLNEQKKEIEKVRDEMNGSLEAGKKLLAE